jgi:hypothetical protein
MEYESGDNGLKVQSGFKESRIRGLAIKSPAKLAGGYSFKYYLEIS